VVHILRQVCASLEEAHVRGLVHRDIKPANILITADAQVKITDFGIAKIESSTLTQVGAVIGTPSYMSPEQFRGEAIDGRADIFAAGIVLYQMLTGERPFSGAASSVMHQILTAEPAPPSTRVSSLHPAFDGVVQKAMAKEAADRFPSAQAFLTALVAAHLAHNGGLPPSEEDNERTVLAFQRPSAPVMPVPAPLQTGGSVVHGSGSHASAANLPGWMAELAPDLQTALSTQIGPLAKLLLRNAAKEAADLDDLVNRLLPHISSDQGRADFQDSVRALKKKHGLATQTTTTMRTHATAVPATQLSIMSGAPTLLQLNAEVMALAQHKLAAYIGPIAQVMVKRASKLTADPAQFYRLLADNVPEGPERARFLKDVGAG
jgi:serine/threonine-protein kinase